MTTALITPPASEPLALDEVKAHLRIDHDHEDTLLAETLKAARQYTEFASGTLLISQVWRQYETCLPADRTVKLKLNPVQYAVSVTAFDREGTPLVVAPDDIKLAPRGAPKTLVLTPYLDAAIAENGLEIDLLVGLGDTGIDVPDALKRAILLLVAHWYEFRGAVSPQDQPVSQPPGFDALIAPFRRMHL